ncbi:MAG: cyclic nucleotide-binding domain-containing protein, partial [Verrucomicrobia bacterium]|nr:cyclic nucleotide-binding domain-containing protein [Verrucomicrobiota bacterium]
MDELIGKIAVLRETNLFKEVTLDVLQEMAYRIQRKKMKQGEVIFNEGDVPLGFYIVSSGEVILKKGGNLLATLKESEFFGESGLLSNNPRLATAIAGKNCTLLYLNNEIFNNLIRNYPEILSIFMQKVIHDLEQTDEPTRFIKSHNFYETAVAQASKILPRISEDKSPEFKEKFHALREMDLFKGLTDEALTPIVEMTQWKTAKKGEVIFSKEDVPDYMYIIFKGSVIVKKGKEELSLLNGHDFFGEAGVVSNQPRMASVIAVEDSLFLRISKESFKTIIAAYP